MVIKTRKEGVVILVDEETDELIALLYKDRKTHKNVFYRTTIMSMDEIEELFNNREKIAAKPKEKEK